jgi:hypothetical protein
MHSPPGDEEDPDGEEEEEEEGEDDLDVGPGPEPQHTQQHQLYHLKACVEEEITTTVSKMLMLKKYTF